MPRSCDPPPDSTRPRSKMSAASSGGVSSSTLRTAPTISPSGSWIASAMSFEVTSWLRGRPDDVASAHLGSQRLLHLDRRADRNLHLLGGSLADQEVVPALEISRDRVVDPVAADANRVGNDHA